MIQFTPHISDSLLKTDDSPKSLDGESPVLYAERLGEWFSARSPQEHKKKHGQFFTPSAISRFMASLITPVGPEMRLLDPGAGCGILSCAACEYLMQAGHNIRCIHLDLYETDIAVAGLLEKCMSYLSGVLARRGITLDYTIHTTDFILEYSESLCDDPVLFSKQSPTYDVCLSNPPYFKLSKSDHRAIAAMPVIHGQPNIYALFMAVGAAMLKKNGCFIFITPRSFASGLYFTRFREYFFKLIQPDRVHLFDSRRDGFKKDRVLQEMIILKGTRNDHWTQNSPHKRATLSVSVSPSARALTPPETTVYAAETLLNMHSQMKVLRLPRDRQEEQLVERISAWPGSFKQYGLRISTGPVVPFRARPFLSSHAGEPGETVPLVWLHHVRSMQLQWPIETLKKPQWLLLNDDAEKLCVRNQNLVLLRRFSAKEEDRRLVAAPYFETEISTPHLGLENHLNYIYRPDGTLTREEAAGLAVLLNSRSIDTYFRVFNGNTQVGATEISLIPLPAYEAIVEAGRQALQAGLDRCQIETAATLFFEPQKETVL